jgi:hypothetical protein
MEGGVADLARGHSPTADTGDLDHIRVNGVTPDMSPERELAEYWL